MSRAANHSDATLIKLDPQANLTDTYAFVGTKSDSVWVRDPDGSGPLSGGVADWMEAWSTANIGAANWNSTDSAATFADTLSFANGGFGNISYSFDDSALNGFFDLNGNNLPDPGEELSSDPGFRAPVSPELIVQ